jgi:putative aldouronate transport system permease protein
MYFGAGLIPYYLLLKKLMLINTFWLYIIPGIMNVYGMILMRTYIESLPSSLHESAYIDGANELVMFFKIIIPLCIPVIAAITLFSCVGHWNSYTDTLIYNSAKPKLYTLQYVLMTFVTTVAATQSENAINDVINQTRHTKLTPMTVRMAITVITVLPISLVYPFLQKYFIKGILIGAVKG